jgi:hypothetical protein
MAVEMQGNTVDIPAYTIEHIYPNSQSNPKNQWDTDNIARRTRMIITACNAGGVALAPAMPVCLAEPRPGESQPEWRDKIATRQALCRNDRPTCEWATSAMPVHEAANHIHSSIVTNTRANTSLCGYKYNDCNTILEKYKKLGSHAGGIFAQDTCGSLAQFIMADAFACNQLGVHSSKRVEEMGEEEVRSTLELLASIRSECASDAGVAAHRGLNAAMYHTRLYDSQGIPVYSTGAPSMHRRQPGVMDHILADCNNDAVTDEATSRGEASGKPNVRANMEVLREHLAAVCEKLPSQVAAGEYGLSCKVFTNELGEQRVGPALHGLPVANVPLDAAPVRLVQAQYLNYFAHCRSKMDCTAQMKSLSPAYARAVFNHMKTNMGSGKWKKATAGVANADSKLLSQTKRGIDSIYKIVTEHPYGLTMETPYGNIPDLVTNLWYSGVSLAWMRSMIEKSSHDHSLKVQQKLAEREANIVEAKSGWVSSKPREVGAAAQTKVTKRAPPTWHREKRWVARSSRKSASAMPQWLELALDTLGA